jgi:glycine/D-amino acid oxidase-like deaminating enzyme
MLSYWERESYFKNIDVCIIGCGIVGLNAALTLKQNSPHSNVLIIERSALPFGASLRNAGFACFGSISEILEDIKSSSENEVLSLIEQRWNGLQLLKKNLGSNELELEVNGGYEIFTETDNEAFNECSTKIEYLNKILKPIIGSSNTFTPSDESIKEFGFQNTKHLIKNNFEGQINTGKMIKSLIKKTQSFGVEILFGLTIDKINDCNNYCELHSKNFYFTAKKILVSTNGFAPQLISNLDIKPARAQVLITQPIKNLNIKGTFHYDKGYYYFRNINDRILLGGGRNLAFEEETTNEMNTTIKIQNSLENLLTNVILPNKKIEIDMRWSGIMGIGNNKLPMIELISKNIAVALRCNGMGVAMGSLTGQKGAQKIMDTF